MFAVDAAEPAGRYQQHGCGDGADGGGHDGGGQCPAGGATDDLQQGATDEGTLHPTVSTYTHTCTHTCTICHLH